MPHAEDTPQQRQSRFEEVCPRLPGESDNAYRASRDYCFMGEGRSLRALLNQYTYLEQAANESLTEKPPTQTFATLGGWSAKYGWVGRAAAWDRELWRLDEQEYLRFWKDYRGRLYRFGEKLLETAEQNAGISSGQVSGDRRLRTNHPA